MKAGFIKMFCEDGLQAHDLTFDLIFGKDKSVQICSDIINV